MVWSLDQVLALLLWRPSCWPTRTNQNSNNVGASCYSHTNPGRSYAFILCRLQHRLCSLILIQTETESVTHITSLAQSTDQNQWPVHCFCSTPGS
jgi:hypothetical protein